MFGDKLKEPMRAPHGGVRFGNFQIAKRNLAVVRNVELQIVAGSELHFCPIVRRFKQQFLDERGHVAVADHAERERSGRANPVAAGAVEIQEQPSVALGQRIRPQSPENGRAGRRAIGQMEAAAWDIQSCR